MQLVAQETEDQMERRVHLETPGQLVRLEGQVQQANRDHQEPLVEQVCCNIAGIALVYLPL